MTQDNTAYAVQENAAYDLSLFEEHKTQKPSLSVTPKNKRHALKSGFVWVRAVSAAAVLLALVVSVLCAHVQSTELSAQLRKMEDELQDLQSQYTYLSTELEMKTNLTAVQSYASNTLGMVKLDRSQVTYVTNEEENRVERPDSPAQPDSTSQPGEADSTPQPGETDSASNPEEGDGASNPDGGQADSTPQA